MFVDFRCTAKATFWYQIYASFGNDGIHKNGSISGLCQTLRWTSLSLRTHPPACVYARMHVRARVCVRVCVVFTHTLPFSWYLILTYPLLSGVVYMHTCVCVCVCIYVHKSHMYICICMHICIRTCMYMHTCIYTYIHTHIHKYVYTYMYTYIHTCTRTYMHTYIHAHIHTCIHTHMHTYWHSYLPTYVHTCTHTYIYTHANKHTHTHINTWCAKGHSLNCQTVRVRVAGKCGEMGDGGGDGERMAASK